ncbi:Tetratricopeptide repeat-domain-containing protein [Triangularia verruculosa]|uniref:Tetratricopeptide repeat-domain-containing protein n=1 Tax=Triangularia verruculosa TaxID=2587418 RepID=A0AAN7ANV0_9PEZI|nr:Tetratricopeptide repeat-domain-containing protein [Triangularia verruculosa]
MLPGACEQVQVEAMSPVEGAALLLRHLGLDVESASEDIRRGCDEVAHNLGHLALAIGLTGAYIGSDPAPGQALTRYLVDYNRHRAELLKMDHFRRLLPTEKTVWTVWVWDTTLDKITKKYANLKLDVPLTFLAHSKGSIVQDELFRLASLGMAAVAAELDDDASEGIPVDLRQYVPVDDRDEWDSFRYRQSRDVLVRYSLLQRVEGEWAGMTMHRLVQWRATRNKPTGRWRRWYMVFILAVCCRITEEQHRPDFHRHLIVHIPDISEDDVHGDKISKRHQGFVGTVLGLIYYDEGRWEEAEKLFVQVMETRKTKLGADHPDTLTSMANLASTYSNQGRWEEAEKLFMQVMETFKIRLGADHPDTLISMGNLAVTWKG